MGQPELNRYLKLREDPRYPETDHAVIVTTSSFTKGAFEDAKPLNIKLLDGMGLATYICNRGLFDLVDEYAPNVPDEELVNPEEYERDVRRKYYGEWSPEQMSEIFDDHEFMHAIEIIENRRVGAVRIKAMDELRKVIEYPTLTPPTDIFVEDPWLMDLNWHGVDILGEQADDLKSNTPTNSANIECEIGIICVKEHNCIHIVCLLPTDQIVSRRHLTALENYVDNYQFEFNSEVDDIDEVHGKLIGADMNTDQSTISKLHRLNRTNFACDTYTRLLDSALRANTELIQAVRPFILCNNDSETLMRIRNLNEFRHKSHLAEV